MEINFVQMYHSIFFDFEASTPYSWIDIQQQYSEIINMEHNMYHILLLSTGSLWDPNTFFATKAIVLYLKF